MKTSHTLQVTAHPYSVGSPRLYHAKDYVVGSTVDNSGTSWVVEEFSGVLLFVDYEGEDVLRAMAKDNVLKPSYKVRKIEGKLTGYIPVLKHKGQVVWEAEDKDWCMWRDIGENSATQHARWKIIQLKGIKETTGK